MTIERRTYDKGTQRQQLNKKKYKYYLRGDVVSPAVKQVILHQIFNAGEDSGDQIFVFSQLALSVANRLVE